MKPREISGFPGYGIIVGASNGPNYEYGFDPSWRGVTNKRWIITINGYLVKNEREYHVKIFG